MENGVGREVPSADGCWAVRDAGEHLDHHSAEDDADKEHDDEGYKDHLASVGLEYIVQSVSKHYYKTSDNERVSLKPRRLSTMYCDGKSHPPLSS